MLSSNIIKEKPLGEEWDKYDGTNGNKKYFEKTFLNEQVKHNQLMAKKIKNNVSNYKQTGAGYLKDRAFAL